jgi:hypothetical protein
LGDEEETVQPKSLASQITPLVQRQEAEGEEEEEEEEPIQAKPLAAQITPLVQRQEAEGEDEEEEEEPIQAKPLAAQITPLVQRQEAEGEEEEEEEEPIQAKPARGSTPHVGPGLAAQIRSLRGGGRPLSRAERGFFEPRFGYDLGHVRTHVDTRAADMARSAKARAFTIGHTIVFGAGQHSPESNSGKRLLAHELTHVVQQGTGRKINRRPELSRFIMRRAKSGATSRTSRRLTSKQLRALSGASNLADLAQGIYAVFVSRLHAHSSRLTKIKLGIRTIARSDMQALRKHLTSAMSSAKKGLRPNSLSGRLLRNNERFLKLMVATIFVANRALTTRRNRGGRLVGDWWDCTTRAAQIHAQAMFIAGFEGHYEHPGGRKGPLKAKDVFTKQGSTLTGTIVGGILQQRVGKNPKGSSWNIFDLRTDVLCYESTAVRWLRQGRQFVQSPLDPPVRIGDIVVWLKARSRTRGRVSPFHLGTIVYIDRTGRVAGIVDTLRGTPTKLYVFLLGTGRKWTKGEKIPGFANFEHTLYEGVIGGFRGFHGASRVRIARYKDIQGLTQRARVGGYRTP